MDKYKNFLGAVTCINNKEKQELVMAFGSADEVYDAPFSRLKSAGIVDDTRLRELVSFREGFDPDGEAESLGKKGIKAVFFDEPAYPGRLKYIADSPYVLYYTGRFPAEDERIVAIVGARACSGYGKLQSIELSKAICSAGYSTISGMAYGIDRACHNGSLEAGGTTYAVLGCGVDACYPGGNRELYEMLKEKGGVISEFYPGTAPLPQFFPRRNRIISGLSFAVLVMEAKLRSGSLITANLALEQGRSVYALPGRVGDGLSAGTNHLISQGAGIIESREYILSELDALCGYRDIQLPQEGIHATASRTGMDGLDENEKIVYGVFEYDAVSLDEIQMKTSLSVMEVIGAVVDLCKRGLIKETFINRYIRVV